MRICLLAPPAVPVPPLAYGGTEAVIDLLARGLAAAGHEVLLVTTGDSTCPVEKTWWTGSALGVGAGSFAELRQVVHGYDAAARWRADVVHDHTVVGPLYAAGIAEAPVVCTNHGPFLDVADDSSYRPVASRVPVIAISRHQASTAPVPVAAVIHHAVDLAQYELGPGGGGYALFVGRMHPDKGVDRAIEIARSGGVPLRISARIDGPCEAEYFEASVRPRLGGEVEYLGETTFEEKVDLLRHADAFLNPIRWHEPFGMVMVEALACGTPVVTSWRGAAPEIVDHGVTGWVSDHDEELREHLGSACSLDRRTCREAAEKRFSTDRMVREHLAVYERLLTASTIRDPRVAQVPA